jgi:iron complex transport system substrate-binding protein
MIAARPGWESLTAVQNKAVYIVDGDIISRAGPRIVDALEAIARALYPELFGA